MAKYDNLRKNAANACTQTVNFSAATLAATEAYLLVGQAAGTSLAVVVTGDVTLTAAGVFTLNANHALQRASYRVEDLAADGDITDRPVFVDPRALTLASIGILTEGAPGGVDAGNTAVITLKDDAGNTIVAKTYDAATQPPTSDYDDLGALDGTHKILTAAEHVTLTIVCGATADLPAFSLVFMFTPTNA